MEKILFRHIFFVLIFVSSFNEFTESRKLILNEITGASLRRNVLYVQSTTDTNKVFQVMCSAPSDIKSATFTWTPNPTDDQGYITNIPGLSSTLNLKNSAPDAVLEFNCTCNDNSTTWEMTRLRYYRRETTLLLSTPIDTFINAADPNAVAITLTCKPPVILLWSSIVWFLDDKQLFPNNTRIQINDNGTSLVIRKPSYQDMGVYLCRVQDRMNLVGFFNLTGGPSIIQRDVANATGAIVDIMEGDSVKLLYSIYGNPFNLSALRWKRTIGDKMEIINADFMNSHTEFNNRLFFNPNTEGPNAELELRKATKNDSANFTLMVDNVYGSSNYTTYVRVKAIGSAASVIRTNVFWFLIILILRFVCR